MNDYSFTRSFKTLFLNLDLIYSKPTRETYKCAIGITYLVLNMNEKFKGILEITFAVVIVLLTFFFKDQIIQLGDYGYLGVFLISLLSSATILLPAPGWAVVFALGRSLDPFYLALFAGLGSGIGELTAYFAGNGIQSIIKNKHLEQIKQFIKNYDIYAILILSFIPNPFLILLVFWQAVCVLIH